VDVLQSVSRLAEKVTGPSIKKAAGTVRRMLATYREAEDLINVGAYVEGSNTEIDSAIAKMPEINDFLVQAVDEKHELVECYTRLGEIGEIPIPEEELGSEALSLQAPAAT
jgi:flagellum-specific ATP synthase